MIGVEGTEALASCMRRPVMRPDALVVLWIFWPFKESPSRSTPPKDEILLVAPSTCNRSPSRDG